MNLQEECLALGSDNYSEEFPFPKITIISGHQNVKQHYKKWQETFEKYEHLL